jgi:hypothetical protein
MQTISLFDPMSTVRANDQLRKLIQDPQGAFQRWKRREVPFYEMCRAVVLTLAGELESIDAEHRQGS